MTEQMPEKVWVWKRKNKQLGADEHKPPFGIPLTPNTPYSQYVREDTHKALSDRVAELEVFIRTLPSEVPDKVHSSAISGATGTGLYTDSASAQVWGEVASLVLESMIEEVLGE